MDPAAAKKLFDDFVMLFVIIDPIGTLPLFLTATAALSARERARVALRASIYAFAILAAFIVGGQILLDAMHIKLGAFEIAGGIVLFLIAIRMVLAEDHLGAAPCGEVHHDIAIFPIALPWLAGPSEMVAVVLLTDNDRYTAAQQAMTGGILAVVMFMTFLALLLATPIQRLLGRSGANIISRVMGIILAALSVELVLTGISTAFKLANSEAAVF